MADLYAYEFTPVSEIVTYLEISETDRWKQSGTSLTVDAVFGAKTVCQATAFTLNGGTFKFVGTNASDFLASTDGSTYTSTLTLTPGANSIYLSVKPTSEGTLSAQVAVPL